jgi:LuxR family transcriptional regulator/LuxR family quorum-sensing system transcriptional regulator CciR
MTKDELLEGAVSATTGLELWQLLLRYCATHGIERVSYHHHGIDRHWGEILDTADAATLRDCVNDVAISPNAGFHIVAHGFPRDWVETYVGDRLYEIDPIPALARRTAEPFLWSDTAELTRLAEEQARYLETLGRVGVGDGVAIQVFGPNMRHGYVGFGFGSQKREVSAAQLAEFQIVAQLLHLRACTIIEERNASDAHLSPREREVLVWLARGKSKSVTADILEISPHTVDTTVRRIFRKLGVSDRTSAVMKAVNSGVIPAMSADVA